MISNELLNSDSSLAEAELRLPLVVKGQVCKCHLATGKRVQLVSFFPKKACRAHFRPGCAKKQSQLLHRLFGGFNYCSIPTHDIILFWWLNIHSSPGPLGSCRMTIYKCHFDGQPRALDQFPFHGKGHRMGFEELDFEEGIWCRVLGFPEVVLLLGHLIGISMRNNDEQ